MDTIQTPLKSVCTQLSSGYAWFRSKRINSIANSSPNPMVLYQ